MKRAMLVIGPESSGTRLTTSILIAAGCFGDSDYYQRMDWRLPTELLVVWRRSLPHDNSWPDLPCMVRGLHSAGYECHTVFTDRADEPMILSQMGRHLRTRDVAVANIERARLVRVRWQLPSSLMQYEELMSHPRETMAALLDPFGLPIPTSITIRDGNAKWENQS